MTCDLASVILKRISHCSISVKKKSGLRSSFLQSASSVVQRGKVARYKDQAICWKNMIFTVKLLHQLHCDTSYMEAGVVMEKDHFLCKQASVFPLDGFLQVTQCLQEDGQRGWPSTPTHSSLPQYAQLLFRIIPEKETLRKKPVSTAVMEPNWCILNLNK
jgi:hypothetical protein